MHRLGLIILLFFSFTFSSQNSWAGKVHKVKGKKVYIKLSADEAENTFKGDTLYLTRKGKKKAIVVIKKMKGNLVIASLKKGKAKKGYKTKKRKGKKKKRMQESSYEDASEVAQNENESSERPDLMFGLMGGFGSATQSVTGQFTGDMTGSLMGFKAILDYAMFGSFGVRGRLGMDMISVEGTSNTGSAATDINYLTLDLLLRWYALDSDSFKFFLNGGFGIYSPMSQDLSGTPVAALDESSISTTSIFIFGLGAGIPVGGMELFVGGDYLMFPKSDTVSTTAFAGKIGLLFAF